MSIWRLNNRFKLHKMSLREDIKINIAVYGRSGSKHKWAFDAFRKSFLNQQELSCSIFTKRFLNDQYTDLKRQEILVQMYKFCIKAWLNLNVNLFNYQQKLLLSSSSGVRFFMCNWSQIKNNSVGMNNSAKMFISMLWCPVMNKHVIYI